MSLLIFEEIELCYFCLTLYTRKVPLSAIFLAPTGAQEMQIFVRLSVSQMKVCLELSVLCFCCFMSQMNEKVNEIFSPSLNPIMSIDEGWIILQT